MSMILLLRIDIYFHIVRHHFKLVEKIAWEKWDFSLLKFYVTYHECNMVAI